MRSYAGVLIMILMFMLIIPLFALGDHPPEPTDDNTSESGTTEYDYKQNTYDTFKVLISATGEVLTLSEIDYIRGVVSAEMPAVYNTEALKAQAVTAFTYAYVKRSEERLKPTADLKGADISDNTKSHQGYVTDEQCRAKWGEKAEQYIKKVKDAVTEVCGNIITYKNVPILAAYHAMSTGNTESAKVVWGNEVPYLQSVPSPGDMLSPSYINVAKIPTDQFKTAMAELQLTEFSDKPEEWIKNIQVSAAKTVTSIEVCGQNFRGGQIRSALGLRSSSFDVVYKKDGNLEFTVYGFGHGVGLSQYGADYMARQGSSWQEIICHYYTGVEIENLKDKTVFRPNSTDTTSSQPASEPATTQPKTTGKETTTKKSQGTTTTKKSSEKTTDKTTKKSTATTKKSN